MRATCLGLHLIILQPQVCHSLYLSDFAFPWDISPWNNAINVLSFPKILHC